MSLGIIFAAVVVTAPLANSTGDSNPSPRIEIPIREVDLSNGMRRYTISVKVGEKVLETGLDTGSTGLRVMPGALSQSDAQAGGWLASDTYSYGSGAQLDGHVAHGVVSLGDATGRSASMTLQVVTHIGCTVRKPDCLAGRVAQKDYGVQGDGLRGEGFRAIIGVNMAPTEVANPLTALGASRWIVELPRPGEAAPGRLILNPTEAEVQGYLMLPTAGQSVDVRSGLHDSVPGCLINLADKTRVCGAVVLDTGAPGVRVHNGQVGRQPWPDGTGVVLIFRDAGGTPRVAENFDIGSRAQASKLTFEDGEHPPGSVIYSGLTPYFAFDVLYDAKAGQLGLKPRPTIPEGPKPFVVQVVP